MTSVTIPDSVTYVDRDAFAECGSLTNVSFGKSVTNIGDVAFFDGGASRLSAITVDPLNPFYSSAITITRYTGPGGAVTIPNTTNGSPLGIDSPTAHEP